MKCPKCQAENPKTKQFCADCGTQLPAPDDHPLVFTETLQTPVHELATGSTFANRYQIIEELGKGGMGKVYKVFDQEVQAKMALKLIKPEVSADKNTIDRFRNELKIARDISHKNICRMYDLGREAGNYFITMEYVSGEDLKSFIRRSRQLVVGTAIFIAKQVCEGLAEAHRVGVVHRDLKPGNIMIDKEGNAKIMDFGIARSISVKGITGAGVMIGTPEYMSPEQVEGKEVDKRSDIYSLGIILYEMLTGQVPFEGDTPFTIGVKQKSEIPKDPGEMNAQIPQDLSRLVLKCLEKDKERRYQNADELRADLEKIEKGIPTAERPVPKRKTVTSKPITLTISRKKFFVPLSMLVAIAIIGIGLWRFLPKHHVAPPPTGKPTLAILYFENISGDKSLDPWKTALTELLITKLSQSKFISVLDGNTIYSILKRLSLDEAKKYTKEDLLKIANQGKATYTLSGSLMKAGPNLIMTLSLQKPHTGEVMSTPSIECKGEEEIFPKVDDLAKTIRSDMNLSPDQIAEDIDKHLGTITTHSPEAFKDFSAAHNLQRRGLNRESIAFYERAIALDPEFASAFLLLGLAHGNLGYWAKQDEYLQKAFGLRDRVSERENLLIQATLFYSSERTLAKAEGVFKTLLQLYPEDYFGNVLLGLLYEEWEEWNKAAERYEVCIQHQYDPTYPYGNQAGAYRAQGLYDKAREVCDYYLDSFGDNATIHLYIAGTFLCQGQYENALKEIDRASFISPLEASFPTKGDVYCCMGDLSRAEIDYQSLLSAEEQIYHLTGRFRLGALYMLQGRFEKSKEQAKWGTEQAEKLADDSLVYDSHVFLAGIYLRSGKYNEALEECNKALNSAVKAESLTRQIRALHLKGLTCLKMKSIDEAKRTADELKRLIDRWPNKKFLRYYYHLIGTTELTEEKYSDATKDMDKARSLLPFQNSGSDEHALFVDSLASAYYRAGNLEKARTEYEAITMLTTGRLRYGDIYAKSFYMLGKIAEQQGDKTHAREQYQQFIELWKDADPGLPEVEDAQKRLATI